MGPQGGGNLNDLEVQRAWFMANAGGGKFPVPAAPKQRNNRPNHLRWLFLNLLLLKTAYPSWRRG